MRPDVRVPDREGKLESALAIVAHYAVAVAQDSASAPAAPESGRPELGLECSAVRDLTLSANDIGTNVAGFYTISDADLVQSALSSIEQHAHLPAGKVRRVVRNGWLILEGEVERRPQRRAAEDAVKALNGIRGFSNNILIESEAMAVRVSQKIDEMLVRTARLSAHRISVTACDHKIILSGCVRSSAEREEAEMAAWAVRGVAYVVNRIRALG
jgi:osmotically-inducible protein OsmY